MNGTELFDLLKNYHDALECLFQRDQSIKELEAKLASRDEHIMSLELKLVQMSVFPFPNGKTHCALNHGT